MNSQNEWKPDPSLDPLITLLLARRHEALTTQLQDQEKRSKSSLAARGLLHGGVAVTAVVEICEELYRVYTGGAAGDCIDALEVAGVSNDAQIAEWLRARLAANFDQVGEGLSKLIGERARKQALPTKGPWLVESKGAAQRDLSIAFETLKLKAQERRPVLTDPADADVLVPLKNKRAFDREILSVLSDAERDHLPVSLLCFDIDLFKRVNDNHGGHSTGNEALLGVAALLESCCRGKGTGYRLGGDEFAVILPNHSVAEAITVAERLRASVQGKPLTSRNLLITISLGIASFPEHGADAKSLFESADAAQYDAKHHGRNLVRIFGEPPPEVPPGPRTPVRRVPEALGFSDQESVEIRSSYFRDRWATCPRDGAMLDIQVISPFGHPTERIRVRCPSCGLTSDID